MAGEYGINLNLRIKNQSGLDRLNSKVKELTKSVDNIRQIDIMNPRNTGGAFGKKARDEIRKYRQDMDDIVKSVNNAKGAFGKTAKQQIAASEALDLYANSIELGTDAHKDALNAALKQAKAIGRESDAINRNTKARNDNNKSKSQANKLNDRSTGSALKSGLVSGAFPLLFGQGLLGGLTGFAGGFIGTKAGGQMGGFAGGLVATALLQQLTTLKSALDELGGSFDEMNPNIDKLTESLGLAGTAEGERLKMIERTQGAHVALEMATEKMNMMIGEEGVKNLREFAETSRIAGNAFKLGLTKLQAFLAPVFKLIATPLTAAAKQEEIERLAGLAGAGKDPELLKLEKQLQKELETNTEIIKGSDFGITGGIGTIKQESDEAGRLRKEIQLRKEALADEGKGIELSKRRQTILDEGLKSITDQNTFLQNQLELGRQGAEIEKLKAEKAKEMEIAVEDLTKKQVKQIEDAVKLNDQLTKTNELYASIGSTIETGLVDAIEGAINGTKNLGDVARSVFTQIQRSLIQAGVNSFLDNLPFKIPGRAEGGPVKRGGSFIVGERGPELFTPGVSGMITPNHDLGGSTNIVVNVDASGSSVQSDGDGQQFGEALATAIQLEIVKQKRSGGLLA